MSDGDDYFGVPDGPGRDLDDIFTAEPGYAERQVQRAEKAAAAEKRDRAEFLADEGEFAAWRARAMGRPVPTVGEFLDGRAGVMAREDSVPPRSASRMRRLRDLADRHGLADLLPERRTTIFDVNVGVLDRDPLQDSADAVGGARADREDRMLGEVKRQLSEDRAFISRVASRPRGEAVRSAGSGREITRAVGLDDNGVYGNHAPMVDW
jgi:hypothetical protein